MTGEEHPVQSKLWPKVSLVLDVIRIRAIAMVPVWKFADVRNLLGSRGGFRESAVGVPNRGGAIGSQRTRKVFVMIGTNETPMAELFDTDSYHLSGKGYELRALQMRDSVEE